MTRAGDDVAMGEAVLLGGAAFLVIATAGKNLMLGRPLCRFGLKPRGDLAHK